MNMQSIVRATERYTVRCFDRFGNLKWEEVFDNIVVTEGLNLLLNRSFDTVAADVNWYVGLIGPGTGTIAMTNGSDVLTGTGTSFAAGDVGSDIIVVGAGAAGVDLKTTIDGQTSGTVASAAVNASTTVSGAAYFVEPRAAATMAAKTFNESAVYSNANRPTWTKNAAAAAGAMSNSASKATFNINASGRVGGAFMTTNNTKSGTTGTMYGGGLFTVSRQVEDQDTMTVQVDLSVTSA